MHACYAMTVYCTMRRFASPSSPRLRCPKLSNLRPSTIQLIQRSSAESSYASTLVRDLDPRLDTRARPRTVLQEGATAWGCLAVCAIACAHGPLLLPKEATPGSPRRG